MRREGRRLQSRGDYGGCDESMGNARGMLFAVHVLVRWGGRECFVVVTPMKQGLSESTDVLDGETFSRASGEGDKMPIIQRRRISRDALGRSGTSSRRPTLRETHPEITTTG